jgi:hypothetical protein
MFSFRAADPVAVARSVCVGPLLRFDFDTYATFVWDEERGWRLPTCAAETACAVVLSEAQDALRALAEAVGQRLVGVKPDLTCFPESNPSAELEAQWRLRRAALGLAPQALTAEEAEAASAAAGIAFVGDTSAVVRAVLDGLCTRDVL